MPIRITGTAYDPVRLYETFSKSRRPPSHWVLSEDERRPLVGKMKGIDLCLEHIKGMPCGEVVSASMDDNGCIKVECDIKPHPNYPKYGKFAQEAFKLGLVPEFSLSHRKSPLVPLELSLVWRGARGGTKVDASSLAKYGYKMGPDGYLQTNQPSMATTAAKNDTPTPTPTPEVMADDQVNASAEMVDDAQPQQTVETVPANAKPANDADSNNNGNKLTHAEEKATLDAIANSNLPPAVKDTYFKQLSQLAGSRQRQQGEMRAIIKALGRLASATRTVPVNASGETIEELQDQIGRLLTGAEVEKDTLETICNASRSAIDAFNGVEREHQESVVVNGKKDVSMWFANLLQARNKYHQNGPDGAYPMPMESHFRDVAEFRDAVNASISTGTQNEAVTSVMDDVIKSALRVLTEREQAKKQEQQERQAAPSLPQHVQTQFVPKNNSNYTRAMNMLNNSYHATSSNRTKRRRQETEQKDSGVITSNKRRAPSALQEVQQTPPQEGDFVNASHFEGLPDADQRAQMLNDLLRKCW